MFAFPQLESEIDLTGKNDWYCFNCHKPGEVLACTSCPRVYHTACLGDLNIEDSIEKFVCLFCKVSYKLFLFDRDLFVIMPILPFKEIKFEENIVDAENRGELNLLISFACARLEEKVQFD